MFSVEITKDSSSILDTTDQPVLLDFWSPRCGACKMISPALEDLAEHYLGQVWIAKVQVEENPKMVERFQVDKLPSLVMVKEGQEVARMEGSHRWEVLNGFIKQYAS